MVLVGEGVEVLVLVVGHVLHTLVHGGAAVPNLLQHSLQDDHVTNHWVLQHVHLHIRSTLGPLHGPLDTGGRNTLNVGFKETVNTLKPLVFDLSRLGRGSKTCLYLMQHHVGVGDQVVWERTEAALDAGVYLQHR